MCFAEGGIHRTRHQRLLPVLREVLGAIREQRRLEEVVGLILEQACALASAAHGSFILVDHESRHLTIANVFGSDWTLEKRLCQLEIGQGLTGKVAASGRPMLCRDTATDPDYYPLFDYVRSELVVPVLVKHRIWGVINIDGLAALEVLRAGRVDLVLTDIRMPGLDGLALHEAASRLDPHYSRRFVFMSGYLLHPDLKSRLAATALPCLEKPFSLDELRRLLEPLLARAQPVAAVS